MTTSLYAGSDPVANPELEPSNAYAELHDAIERQDFEAASRARRALMRPGWMILPLVTPTSPVWGHGGGR